MAALMAMTTWTIRLVWSNMTALIVKACKGAQCGYQASRDASLATMTPWLLFKSYVP